LVHIVKEKSVTFENIEWLIFDEADKLFESKFIEQVDGIISACRPNLLKICLFSATMSPAIEKTVHTVQDDPVRIVIGAKNAATETIDQQLLFTGSEEGKLIALRTMIKEGKFRPPVLFFVQSIERAQELFHQLTSEGITVGVIHSERTQIERNEMVDRFRSGQLWALITTELMARGMDFKNVSLVINFDFPQSVTSYIHRIGRTGRAGRRGEAITFYTEEDFEQLRSIANVMRASGCKNIPSWIFTSLRKPSKKRQKQLEIRPIERDSVLINLKKRNEVLKQSTDPKLSTEKKIRKKKNSNSRRLSKTVSK